jgi:sulfane dehydrogenase subunit SoxC
LAALHWRPAQARHRAGDPLITEIQDWNRYLGDGVDARPYGTPSEHEKDVVRRNVEWLTADPVSSINFTPLHDLDGIITPERAVLRASPWRHCRHQSRPSTG